MTFCYTQQISIVLIFMVLGAFLYQIVLVWMISYQYQIKYERRLQIMIMCAAYCIFSILYYFIHSLARLYLTMIIALIHYQICAFTFLYYTNKIMGILPDIKKQMTKTLNCAHIL